MDSSVTAAGAAGAAGGPRSKKFPIPPLKLVGDTVEAEIEGDMAAMELSDPVRRWVGLPNDCGWAGSAGCEEDAGGCGDVPAAAVTLVVACPPAVLAPPTVEGAAAKPVVATPVVSIALVVPAAPVVPAGAVASAAACPSSSGILVGGPPWPPWPPGARPEPSRVPPASAPTPRREAAGTPMGGDADSLPFPRCPLSAAPGEIPSTSLSAHESLLSPLLEWKETDFWRRGRLPPRRESPENELVRLAEAIVVDEWREERRRG